MKTSNKLLLGMLFLILFLLTTGFVHYTYLARKKKIKSKEEIFKPEKFDSLIIKNTFFLTLAANKGTLTISTQDAALEYKNNTLTIKGGKNVIVDISENIKYLSLENVYSINIHYINADSLIIKANTSENMDIFETKLKKLNLILNKSFVTFNNSKIQNIEFVGKNVSGLFVGEKTNIDTINGVVDATTEIHVKGIKKMNVDSK